MNIKVSFDAATIADAIQKAARVAPTKGASFDRAAGIQFDRVSGSEWVYVRSTNLDTTYLQKVKPLEVNTPGSFSWRVPSNILSGLVSALPLDEGKTINLVDTGDKALRITSGNVKVKLSLISGEFPTVTEFPTDDLSQAHDFAQKASQVTWACDKDGILSGVYCDGESLIGCNRTTAAIIPCEMPIDKPIVVPLWNIGTVLRSASDVRLAARERELHIMLDSESQATSRLIEGEYPPVKKLRRDDYTGEAVLPTAAITDAMNRMLVVARSERLPTIKLTFNVGSTKSLTLDLDVPDTGRIQDTVDITGTYDDSFEIFFTPAHFMPALENARAEQVTMKFGHPDRATAHLKTVTLLDGKGYEALVTPRKP